MATIYYFFVVVNSFQLVASWDCTGDGYIKDVSPTFEEGLTQFSFSLYNKIEKQGNEFISPHSISSALLLLSLGTDGTTEHQIFSSVFKDDLPTNIHQEFKILSEKLTHKQKTGIVLSMANRIFCSHVFKIFDDYVSNASQYYSNEAETLDFVTQAEQSRKHINNWIAAQTKDKIMDMLPFGIINANTIMVLTNAIYFKGAWEDPFYPNDTRKEKFYVNPTSPVNVDMMFAKSNALSGESKDFDCKVLELPYVGNELSMVFFLPNNKDGLSKLEARFTFANYQHILSTARFQKTIVRIPKFKIEEEYDLKPNISVLGITEIFSPEAANFSKMVSKEVNDISVSVTDARHKAYVEVNEKGSEAAAAITLMVVECGYTMEPPPFEFVADHPFLFIIYHRETRTILFPED